MFERNKNRKFKTFKNDNINNKSFTKNPNLTNINNNLKTQVSDIENNKNENYFVNDNKTIIKRKNTANQITIMDSKNKNIMFLVALGTLTTKILTKTF